MQLSKHVIASGVFSVGFYKMTGSFELAMVSFFSGFLIDLDHLFDYWIQHPFKTDISHFFETCQEYKLKKLFLVLHSIELAALVCAGAICTKSVFLLGLSLGISQHLIFDILTNPMNPYGYSLAYRISQKFAASVIYSEEVINGQN